MKNNYLLTGRRTSATRGVAKPQPKRQTEPQVIAQAVPGLFTLVSPAGPFLTTEHNTHGMLAVVFASPWVAGQYLSHKPQGRVITRPVTQLRPTCHAQITEWCKAGKCQGYWLVDEHNLRHDYPCDNIVVWAVRDPESGLYLTKGGAA